MSPDYPFNIRSKGQRSRSQGYKVQKHISVELEGDRVAGVSLHSIEWSPSGNAFTTSERVSKPIPFSS